MEYMKLLEIMTKVQMDDLTDAEMLMDYAKESMEYGSEEIHNKLLNRAKTRMQNYDTCSADIENIISKMKAEDPEINEKAVMYDMQKYYITDWKNRIKDKIASM